MVFHAQLGLQTELVNPETKEKVKTMLPVAALICYFVAIFPIVNLPSKKGPIQSAQHNAGRRPPLGDLPASETQSLHAPRG